MWNLNTTNVEEQEQERKPWQPVPKGTYKVIFNKFEIEEPRESAKGATYRGVKVSAQILEGEHAQMIVSDYVIVEHSTSEIAQNIGQQFVKKLVIATSADPNMDESKVGQLLNVPVMIRVDVEAGREYTDAMGETQKYPDRNRIRDVKPIDSLEDLLSGNASSKPKPAAEAVAKSAPSWMD